MDAKIKAIASLLEGSGEYPKELAEIEKAKQAYKLTTIPYLIIVSPAGGVEFVSKNAKSAVRRMLMIIN